MQLWERKGRGWMAGSRPTKCSDAPGMSDWFWYAVTGWESGGCCQPVAGTVGPQRAAGSAKCSQTDNAAIDWGEIYRWHKNRKKGGGKNTIQACLHLAEPYQLLISNINLFVKKKKESFFCWVPVVNPIHMNQWAWLLRGFECHSTLVVFFLPPATIALIYGNNQNLSLHTSQ